MLRWLYSVLMYLAIPFILIRLFWRGRKAPAYRLRWSERFGFIPLIKGKPIWLHAVSLGEARAAIPLIRELQQRFPQTTLLITCMTPTGSQQISDTFSNQVEHVYLPYDFPDAVGRQIESLEPVAASCRHPERTHNTS